MSRAPSGNGGARWSSTQSMPRPTTGWATRWMRKGGRGGPVRTGGGALAFGVRALEHSGGNDPRLLDTLAAAYAEKGQFADAVLTARRAQAQASQENQPALADEVGSRIALYEAEQPFRDRHGSPPHSR